MPRIRGEGGIMIAERKVNPQRYGRLLAKALPGIIETEEENERILAEVDKLWDKDLSPEEAKLFNLMVKLIQDFEDKHYNLNATTPLHILKHFMEVRGAKPRDLWEVFGSKGITSEVLSGKRAISKTHARKLAGFFGVSADLFI
jgi:HTH-type transcriptional regulator/antitoxin HigA